MNGTFVIRPNVINALGGDPLPSRRVNNDNHYQPQPRKSFWGKVKGFFKKFWGYIVTALAITPPIVNACARYKDATRRSAQGAGGKKAYCC